MKGATINATKPVEADMITGHIGDHYAADWFALRPVAQWSGNYFNPVATSSNGNPAYVYIYNPNAGSVTVNYATLTGAGSFVIPSGASFQYQMPKGSGAKFSTAGGEKIFAICTVGANPTATISALCEMVAEGITGQKPDANL